MKIEKLNDNQIRCTLTHADLAARHLKLSELAYGTEKAKSLFRDMMQQASFDFGFEADDIPLMIEAIPASSDSIVLIITKVEDPDELDARFSKFTSPSEGSSPLSDSFKKLEGADGFMDLLNKVKDAASSISPASSESEEEKEDAPAPPNVRLYSFDNIDLVIRTAKLIEPLFHGANTLYQDSSSEGIYLLTLTPSEQSNDEFNKVCNILSEYGSPEKVSTAILAFLEEHCETVISADAVQKLSQI